MLRWSGLAMVQVMLATAMLALGIPATLIALNDFGFYSRVDPTGRKGGEGPAELQHETPQTAGEGRDLAFALLAHGNDPELSEAEQSRVVNQAVQGFRDYLSEVPADGQAWAGLASAEIQLGDLGRAAEALRMSILTSPWSESLVQWRCGLGIDLYRVLDDEERELMKGQFRVAAQRSVASLVRTVIGRKGTRIARAFLASSPDELIRFEAELERRH